MLNYQRVEDLEILWPVPPKLIPPVESPSRWIRLDTSMTWKAKIGAPQMLCTSCITENRGVYHLNFDDFEVEACPPSIPRGAHKNTLWPCPKMRNPQWQCLLGKWWSTTNFWGTLLSDSPLYCGMWIHAVELETFATQYHVCFHPVPLQWPPPVPVHVQQQLDTFKAWKLMQWIKHGDLPHGFVWQMGTRLLMANWMVKLRLTSRIIRVHHNPLATPMIRLMMFYWVFQNYGDQNPSIMFVDFSRAAQRLLVNLLRSVRITIWFSSCWALWCSSPWGLLHSADVQQQ